ncbi:MAG: sulfotransferase, partial [Candidatus Marinimicrobia bacterium]|nr:sulfotransferase [Candidatus Neomarinimicrobiota bacterium]
NLQELCIAGGHETAHFFTREGIFFQRVFDRVQAHELFDMHPVESRLLPVSRLASFFPSLQDISPGEMMRLWSQYHTQSVNSFLGSLGVSPERYHHVIRKNGIDPEDMISSPWQDRKFLRLFDDDDFIGPLKEEQRARRENLKDFYHDCGFGSDGKALVIDIGWRGTIQDNLALIFKDVTIEGCYLGLQEFFNSQPENTIKHGYIADANRGEHHVMLKHVMPFEMLCFGTGGSAIGYRRNSSGKMAAEFQVDPVEDQIHNERIHFFQEGVLEGVDQVCRTVARHGISIQELRTDARALATHFLTTPPMIMCRAFNALKQDDTFGMARTIFPGESSFRLSDRLLTFFSATRRQRFLADLEKSSWPQCLLRSRYFGVFHRLGSMKKVTHEVTRSVGDKVFGLRKTRQLSLDTYPVRVVITGMEHSGTTLLSMLLKQDVRLKSGFECGFLLAARPRDFSNINPWYEWMQEPVEEHHWGVSAKHMESICSSKSWLEAYQKLMEYSPVFDQGQTQQICDKTPRYLMYLDDVLDKVPDFVPCIVIEKNIENLWRSHKKRYGHLGNFCKNFERYGHGLRRALAKHGERIYRVQYGELCRDLNGQLRDIFSIIDLPFKAEYVSARHDRIQQYYQERQSQVDEFSEEEKFQLGRLRSKFSDLLM